MSANAKYTWCVEATKLLILEYENYEHLYNSKHPDYKNRIKRQEIYKNIADTINMVKPGCVPDDIRKKINGLRSQFLSEKMKVLNSIRSGADGDDVYTPTVYWYPMLKFLEASTTGDDSISNIENEEETTVNSQNIHNDSGDESNSPNRHASTSFENYSIAGGQSKKRKVNPDINDGDNLSYKPANTSSESNRMASGRRKTQKINPDALLLQASKTMTEMSQLALDRSSKQISTNEDSFDTFGKFIANELRSVNNECQNKSIVREAKIKIQKVVMDAWDAVESMPSTTSSATTDSFAEKPTIIVQNFRQSDISEDVIADCLSKLNDMASQSQQ